jgi:hypothetical protein
MPIRREPTTEEIAARAYELYEQHGRVEGRAVEDWLEAKAELEAAEVAAESEDAGLLGGAGAPGAVEPPRGSRRRRT